MQSTDKPDKFSIPFANAGTKNTIPTASQIGITAGAASLTDGFPPLTFTPVAAGGVPPSGADFNGILNQLTKNDRWAQAGGGYPYDSAFSTSIGGYPKGANVPRTDGNGFWISQQDANTVDPESDTTAKWLPSGVSGAASVTMTSSNVTLTNLQAGFDVIVLSGTLTANLNLVFPVWKKNWTIINNCTGSFTVTAKTASGTGVSIPATVATQVSGDGINIQTSSGVANGSITPAKLSQPFTSGTAVASTSGTSIDFIGIPSWVKRITVMFNGVSTNSTSFKQIQLGDSGGVKTTGYVGMYSLGGSGTGSFGGAGTTGFVIGSNTAAETLHGAIIFSLLDASTNLWAATGSVGNNTGTFYFYSIAGTKSLSATLDRIRITTVNGTDTFDAGSINLLWE